VWHSFKSFSTLTAVGAAGVAGAALDATSQFVPNEIGQGICIDIQQYILSHVYAFL